jgi:hypothetical protein
MSYDLPWKNYGNYVISNKGQVFSRYKNKLLKPHLHSEGYLKTCLDKKRYSIHRLVYELFGKNWNPKMSIDHINQDRQDNFIKNLRLVNYTQNRWNSKHKNTVGLTGVYIKPSGKFASRIKNIYLGTFDTAEKAHEVYKEKAKELYSEFMSFHLSN